MGCRRQSKLFGSAARSDNLGELTRLARPNSERRADNFRQRAASAGGRVPSPAAGPGDGGLDRMAFHRTFSGGERRTIGAPVFEHRSPPPFPFCSLPPCFRNDRIGKTVIPACQSANGMRLLRHFRLNNADLAPWTMNARERLERGAVRWSEPRTLGIGDAHAGYEVVVRSNWTTWHGIARGTGPR